MVAAAPAPHHGRMGDSFSVDTSAVGALPWRIGAVRTDLGGVRVEAAARLADAACGSSSGGLGITTLGNAVDAFVAVAGCALERDAARLRGVAAGYDRADRDAASQCTAPLAGGWW